MGKWIVVLLCLLVAYLSQHAVAVRGDKKAKRAARLFRARPTPQPDPAGNFKDRAAAVAASVKEAAGSAAAGAAAASNKFKNAVGAAVADASGYSQRPGYSQRYAVKAKQLIDDSVVKMKLRMKHGMRKTWKITDNKCGTNDTVIDRELQVVLSSEFNQDSCLIMLFNLAKDTKDMPDSMEGARGRKEGHSAQTVAKTYGTWYKKHVSFKLDRFVGFQKDSSGNDEYCALLRFGYGGGTCPFIRCDKNPCWPVSGESASYVIYTIEDETPLKMGEPFRFLVDKEDPNANAIPCQDRETLPEFSFINPNYPKIGCEGVLFSDHFTELQKDGHTLRILGAWTSARAEQA